MKYHTRFNDYQNDDGHRLKCCIGGLVGSIFGDSGASEAPLTGFKPTGFKGGGINAKFNKKKVKVTADEERTGRVSSLASVFSEGARGIRRLLSRVAPGFSSLRTSRLNNLRDIRQRTIGSLSDNLAKRRVSGSSFGNDTLVRAEREFAREEDEIIAETTLAEIGATVDLIKQSTAFAAQAVQTFINELNLEANIGLQLASQATAVLGANAIAQSQAIQANTDSSLDFFGTIIGAAVTYATAGAG